MSFSFIFFFYFFLWIFDIYFYIFFTFVYNIKFYATCLFLFFLSLFPASPFTFTDGFSYSPFILTLYYAAEFYSSSSISFRLPVFFVASFFFYCNFLFDFLFKISTFLQRSYLLNINFFFIATPLHIFDIRNMFPSILVSFSTRFPDSSNCWFFDEQTEGRVSKHHYVTELNIGRKKSVCQRRSFFYICCTHVGNELWF